MRQPDWLQYVLPPKTARAKGEAFRHSPKSCSYQRAKHVNTSTRRHLPLRVATPLRCRVPLCAVRRFHVRRFSASSRSSTRRRLFAPDARQHLRRRAITCTVRNRHGEHGSAAARPAKQSGSRTFYPSRTF